MPHVQPGVWQVAIMLCVWAGYSRVCGRWQDLCVWADFSQVCGRWRGVFVCRLQPRVWQAAGLKECCVFTVSMQVTTTALFSLKAAVACFGSRCTQIGVLL